MCFCKFCNPAFQGQLFLGNKLGAAAHAEARPALSLPASHLDHQGTASLLTFSSGRFFGGLKKGEVWKTKCSCRDNREEEKFLHVLHSSLLSEVYNGKCHYRKTASLK